MTKERKSPTLLRRLLATRDEAERGSVVRELISLDDQRVVEPLMRIAMDNALGDETRNAACNVLLEIENMPDLSDQELRRQWETGDQVIQRFAVSKMTGAQRDLIDAVLRETYHHLHADAVAALAFGFPQPWASEQLIHALGHSEAEVRREAAEALVWREPIIALTPLTRAANDAVPDVAIAALHTLCYYPTIASIRCAHALRAHHDVRVREAAQNCLQWVRADLHGELRDPILYDSLKSWLTPVWDLVDVPSCDATDARSPVRTPHQPFAASWLASAIAFREHLEAWDVPTEERRADLQDGDWGSVALDARAGFAQVLKSAQDVHVRRAGCRVLAEWGAREDLRTLLHDPSRDVRRAAMYHFQALGPDPEAAELAWTRVLGGTLTESCEALQAFVSLGAPGTWVGPTSALLLDASSDENLRCTAVWSLERALQADALRPHLRLLRAAPQLTWGLHVALINAAIALELALPSLGHLDDIDDLQVQVALAKARKSARWSAAP